MGFTVLLSLLLIFRLTGASLCFLHDEHRWALLPPEDITKSQFKTGLKLS